jgi:hypothetical protein
LWTSALGFGCGGGLGPSAGGTGAGSGPVEGSGGEQAGGETGGSLGTAGQGTAGIAGSSTSGGTTSIGGAGTACPVGDEGCTCYGNDTCNSGLTCASHLCVNLAGTGGTATGGVATGGRATGGVATGGRATGGVATGGAVSTGGGPIVTTCTPDGPCTGQSCPICTVFTTITYNSSVLGTGASCYETTAAIQNGNCGNFVVPRTLTINGTYMDCPSSWSVLPAKVNGGYCFVISAGDYAWAYFSTY